jgi:hypothetical protein
MDSSATSRNAIPAHHRFCVKNQTMKAIIAAGINIKSRRMTKMIIRPIMIKPIRPKRSKPKKLKFSPQQDFA